MRKVVAFAWLVAGCGLSVVGVENAIVDGGSVADSGGPTPIDAEPTPGKDAAVDADADADVDADAGPPCDPTPCPGKRCNATGCDYYADCKGLDDALSPPSAIYTFRANGASSSFEAYCEMQLSGGGWTLAGQSAPMPSSGDFGWGTTLGDVKVEDKAYTLNALEKKLAVHEILVASGTKRAQLRTAYLLKAPSGFPGAPYLDGGVQVVSVTKVMNPDCPKAGDDENPNGPGMFQWIGFTLSPDGFYFRDNKDPGTFGLQRNRWQLNYDKCNNAGLMNGQQGMVFVR